MLFRFLLGFGPIIVFSAAIIVLTPILFRKQWEEGKAARRAASRPE